MEIYDLYENTVTLPGQRPLTRDACSLTHTNIISSRGDKLPERLASTSLGKSNCKQEYNVQDFDDFH